MNAQSPDLIVQLSKKELLSLLHQMMHITAPSFGEADGYSYIEKKRFTAPELWHIQRMGTRRKRGMWF